MAGVIGVVLVILLGFRLLGGSDPADSTSPTPEGAATAGLRPTATATRTKATSTRTRTTAPSRSGSSSTSRTTAPQGGSDTCALGGLTDEAKDTVAEIFEGGPFPYRQDGVIFDNRERRLPSHQHGYYHEYTVRTPGSPDRGARRVIAGGTNTKAPEVLYYTGNHYASFCLVSGLD